MPEELEQFCAAESPGELASILEEVVAEVLATMFFADAEPAPCDHVWLDSAVSARLGFEGTHFGEALLSVSRPAAESAAAAFLGLDEKETTEMERCQVILELANILCGAVLSRLWPESKLTLSAPIPDSSHTDLEGALHRCFSMPEGNLACWIRLGGAKL
jgi:hypothetical protein